MVYFIYIYTDVLFTFSRPPNSIPTKQVDNYAWIWIVTTLGAICISCIPVCLWFIYHRSKGNILSAVIYSSLQSIA